MLYMFNGDCTHIFLINSHNGSCDVNQGINIYVIYFRSLSLPEFQFCDTFYMTTEHNISYYVYCISYIFRSYFFLIFFVADDVSVQSISPFLCTVYMFHHKSNARGWKQMTIVNNRQETSI